MLQVTPLFAGSPSALAVSPTVPPASTKLLAAEMVTVMIGGGGGGPLLPQPAMSVTKSSPASKRVRTELLFTGPPQRSGLQIAGQLPVLDIHKVKFIGLDKAGKATYAVINPGPKDLE